MPRVGAGPRPRQLQVTPGWVRRGGCGGGGGHCPASRARTRCWPRCLCPAGWAVSTCVTGRGSAPSPAPSSASPRPSCGHHHWPPARPRPWLPALTADTSSLRLISRLSEDSGQPPPWCRAGVTGDSWSDSTVLSPEWPGWCRVVPPPATVHCTQLGPVYCTLYRGHCTGHWATSS